LRTNTQFVLKIGSNIRDRLIWPNRQVIRIKQ